MDAANSIQDLFRQTNPYEQFVEQLVALESQTKFKLEAQRSEEEGKKSALGQVSSSISRFVNHIDELQSTSDNPFHALSTDSSNEGVARVESADGFTQTENFQLTVDRTASHDTALSRLMTGDGTDLADQGDGTVEITIGDRTELIEVASTYEDEQGNTVEKTNREILEALADEIGQTFGEEARANLFTVDSEQVQFSMQSRQTGFSERLQFGAASGALGEVFSDMDRLVPENELNAQFTIDGVTFERESNRVDDAVDGLVFELTGETGQSTTLSVSPDPDKARSSIDNLVSEFNRLNGRIREQTFIDAENDERGPLQNIRSIRNLTYNLRQTGLLGMEGTDEGELARLSDIGIGFENDGSMVIEDSTRLNEMLAERPDEVERLFTGEGSVISTMKQEAEMYVKGSSGILNTLESGIDQTIDRLDRRIAAQQRHLEQYEERQREEFNELQRIIEDGEAQFSQVMGFRNSMGM